MAFSEDSRFGRRRFLTTTAVAGTGIALGGLLLPSRGSALRLGSVPPGSGGPDSPNTAQYLSDLPPFDPNGPVGSKPDLPRRLVFTVPTINEYYKQISDNIELACKERDIEYQVISSENDPAKNIDQINQVLQRGVAGLVVQPDDAAAQAVPLQTAIDSGVCVIFFVTAPATMQTAADQWQLGYDQAVKAVEWINENLDGKANVVNFTFDHIEALIPRHEGTLAGLATGGDGINLVLEQELQDNTADEGFEFASTIFQAHPEVNVWIGPDDPGLGVDQFLQSQDLDPATDKILVSGLNGGVAGKAAVASGTSFLRHDMAFGDPVASYCYGAFVGDWLDGKTIPQALVVQGTILTNADEVAAFDAQLADPAATFQSVVDGTNSTTGLLGNINYDTRGHYLVNSLAATPR